MVNPLAVLVQDQYEAAFLDKESLGLHSDWATFEEYYLGQQNQAEDEDDPASNTNIVMPNVESMVSDLVMAPLEILVQGWSRSDRMATPRLQRALEWVWEKNRMTPKRDAFEHHRVKFGTGIFKISFLGSANGGVGMPIVEAVPPHTVFVDPKVKAPSDLSYADYVIHAVNRPLSWLRRTYGSAAKELAPQSLPAFNPNLFELGTDTAQKISGDKALILERWTLEEGGRLRKVVVSQGVVLYDSDRDPKRQEGYYRLDRYPYVFVPCYLREGRLWGSGDVEFLIPTQDIINDLDDQIRMNARLMGNIQMVIGAASGINPFRWTNKPGLKIPARDVGAWRAVEPPNMPGYILNRRSEALTYESQVITGRSDVVEGRRPGSVRAASAIIALQEAGSRRVNHKKLLAQEGLSEVFRLIADYITEYWTEEVEIGEEIYFRGADLKDIPLLRPQSLGEEDYLLDDQGQTVRRPLAFDVSVNLGTGIAMSKAGVYQMTLEAVQYNIITREEARSVMKQILGYPIIDPLSPQGVFPAQSQTQPAAQNMTQGMDVMEAMQALPPELMAQLTGALGGVPLG